MYFSSAFYYDVEFSGGLTSEVGLLYACLSDGEINAGRLNSMSQDKRQGEES